MPFDRQLDVPFIDALNELHADHSSWWRTLVDDDSVFLAIRRNTINAYANGGSIAHIRWHDRRIDLRVHSEYLTLPLQDDKYIVVKRNHSDSNAGRPLITTQAAYVEHLAIIKKRARRFAGDERAGENSIASSLPCVVDMEAAFNTATEVDNPELSISDEQPSRRNPSNKASGGRIDLVAISSDGRIVFTEAKLYSNQEIRSKKVPKVCRQLSDYKAWLSKESNRTQIITSYGNLLSYYDRLQGGFFNRRRLAHLNLIRNPSMLRVDPIPRLLVFGFDAEQLTRLTKDIIPGITHGLAEPFRAQHVRFLGDGTSKKVKAQKVL